MGRGVEGARREWACCIRCFGVGVVCVCMYIGNNIDWEPESVRWEEDAQQSVRSLSCVAVGGNGRRVRF